MTKNGIDKLTDPDEVQARATRAYKGEPEPADPPPIDPEVPPLPVVPGLQGDTAGMKSVEDEQINGAGKATE